MSNKDVWIAFTKNRPLEGCGIDFDGCEFYFTDICVPIEATPDKLVALGDIIEMVKCSLEESRLELVDISMLVRYKNGEWKTNTDSFNDINALAVKAGQSGKIVLSSFRSEEIEELQTYRHSIIESDYE
ncbi:MAG: hypothetical protein GXP23_06990 [Gammaproteobacteria bacterium]|nr:hypothetical protein [Gammaproteobacteria bacterium]